MCPSRHWEVKEDALLALEELRNILQSIDHYPAVEDEVEAMYAQLKRITPVAADPAESNAGSPAPTGEEREQERLRVLAKESVAKMSLPDICPDKDMLDFFVSELVREILDTANQIRHTRRRQRQAEGIAAAKEKGIRFGTPRKPLPENFEEAYQAWKNQELSLAAAARLCGMARASFRNAVAQAEKSTGSLEEGANSYAPQAGSSAQKRTADTIRHHPSPALSYAGTGGTV